MSVHKRAGQLATDSDLINVPRLISDYYTQQPTTDTLVNFGTSGHRGSSSNASFTEVHVQAICQALVEYRQQNNVAGPLFLGIDTHALSECAFSTALQVLVANGVYVVVQLGRHFQSTTTLPIIYTPTPVISHAILAFNKSTADTNTTVYLDDAKPSHASLEDALPRSVYVEMADGIVITPSHNPPEDGGFKYNTANGGPANSKVTTAIQTRANAIIIAGNDCVKEVSLSDAWHSEFVVDYDFIQPYVDDLTTVIDMQAIAKAKIRIGVDPLGGSGIAYWDCIAKTYGIEIDVVNRKVDPSFAFMPLDRDGKIRMDCSSPYAMANLIHLKDDYDIAIANDPDFDRHGIVTGSQGLMSPNQFLAVAIDYLYQNRPQWPEALAIGKTLVSSSMIDRIAKRLNRKLLEVPVGFKWFVDDLFKNNIGFAGEESAGASFLRRDGSVWTTDKDGIILGLLAAEITAVTGIDPSRYYKNLTEEFNAPFYRRIDAKANVDQKNCLSSLSQQDVTASSLAGEKIIEKLTHAPGNNAAIGGLKVVTENSWFAARPSGTEDVYKIYAESFKSEAHLEAVIDAAQVIVNDVFTRAGIQK
jgi:phosphoglucomutase